MHNYTTFDKKCNEKLRRTLSFYVYNKIFVKSL